MAADDPFAQYAVPDSTNDPFAAYTDTAPDSIKYPAPRQDSTGAPSEATRTGTPPSNFSQPMSSWSMDLLQAALPTIGVMLATRGLGTLPGMILRGGAGATGGEALKMGMEAARGQGVPDWQQALMRLSGAGAEGMGSTALGGMGARLIPTTEAAAVNTYQRALNPNAGIRKGFRDVVERGLERKIPVTAEGAARAEAEVKAAASTARGIRQTAQQQGTSFKPRDLAGPAIREAIKTKGGPLTREELARVIRGVEQQGNRYLKEASAGSYRPPRAPKPSRILNAQGSPAPAPKKPPTKWTPQQVDAIRRLAGKQASPGMRAAESGKIQAGNVGPSTVAAGARAALKKIPGHGEAQKEVQSAMGLNRAMIDATTRPQDLFPLRVNMQRFPWSTSLRPDLASGAAINVYNLPPYLQAALRNLVLRGPQVGMGGVHALLDQPAPPDTFQTENQ